MDDAMKFLEEYYSNYDEDGRLGSRHGQVEFLTTVRYVEKYLFPGARILEIGAGTGRYSHHFAQAGYAVDAVELIEHNIEIFRANTLPDEAVTARQGDARDLSAFPGNSYDLTLLLGPMYHLCAAVDQKRALSEAIRVTKKGGVVFAAYCGNDATMVQFCFGQGRIRDPYYQARVDPVTFKASSTPEDLFVLYRKEDVDALMEGFPVERLHYVGTDMATRYMQETVDAMDDGLFERYLRYHFSICERPDLVGASHHLLDVFRKRG